jgi:hypothetical protein
MARSMARSSGTRSTNAATASSIVPAARRSSGTSSRRIAGTIASTFSHAGAPDLAALVDEEQLTFDEAWTLLERRRADHAAALDRERRRLMAIVGGWPQTDSTGLPPPCASCPTVRALLPHVEITRIA